MIFTRKPCLINPSIVGLLAINSLKTGISYSRHPWVRNILLESIISSFYIDKETILYHLLSPSLHYSSLPSPLVTVSLFFISMSLVIFCLLICFVDYVPLIGEIIWYLSFTAWFTSLSIMLSSSIHAVTKGRSSFFISAV